MWTLASIAQGLSNKDKTTVLLHHSPIHLYDRHSFIDRYSWSLTRSWLAEGFGNCSYRPGPIATPSNSIQQPYNNHVHLWDRSEATIYGLLSYEGHLLRAKFWRHRDYQFNYLPFRSASLIENHHLRILKSVHDEGYSTL